jgi:DNA-binding MarR family transcriptional regulator
VSGGGERDGRAGGTHAAPGPAGNVGVVAANAAEEPVRWLDDREQRAWRSYLLVQHGLNRVLERQLQRDTGLSIADYTVLVQLSEAPERRRRHFELGRAIGWEKSRLSHHLTRMVQRGLVAREACPEDSRGGFVVLTESGVAAIAAAAPLHVAHVRRWFIDRLSEQQLDALVAIGDAVAPGLDDVEGAAG